MIPAETVSAKQPSAFSEVPLRRRSRQHLYGVLRGAVQVFAIRVVGAGVAYASMILLARWLGSYSFGLFAFVLVIVTQLGLAFSFGFNSSTLRFTSSYLARKKIGRLHGFLRQSYCVVFGLSCLGALVSAGVLLAFPALAEPYSGPLLVGLLCVPIWSLLNQLESTARAFQWVHVAYIPGYVLRPLLLIALVGGGVALGGVPDAVSAVWALFGACAIAAAVQGLIVYRRVRNRVAQAKPTFHARHWFAVSFSFLIIDGFRMLLDNTDLIMIGWLLDPRSVAVYFAVIRTGGLVAFVSFAIIALAVPKFTEVHSTGTPEDLQKLVSQVIHLIFWPSLLVVCALAIAGPYLLSLFGADFAIGYPTFLVVLAGLLMRSATLPVEYLLNMTGHHRDTLRVYACAAVANFCFNLVLIPALGILGAAIASYGAMLGANACLYFLVRKRLGVRAFLLPLPRRIDPRLGPIRRQLRERERRP